MPTQPHSFNRTFLFSVADAWAVPGTRVTDNELTKGGCRDT